MFFTWKIYLQMHFGILLIFVYIIIQEFSRSFVPTLVLANIFTNLFLIVVLVTGIS